MTLRQELLLACVILQTDHTHPRQGSSASEEGVERLQLPCLSRYRMCMSLICSAASPTCSAWGSLVCSLWSSSGSASSLTTACSTPPALLLASSLLPSTHPRARLLHASRQDCFLHLPREDACALRHSRVMLLSPFSSPSGNQMLRVLCSLTICDVLGTKIMF